MELGELHLKPRIDFFVCMVGCRPKMTTNLLYNLSEPSRLRFSDIRQISVQSMYGDIPEFVDRAVITLIRQLNRAVLYLSAQILPIQSKLFHE